MWGRRAAMLVMRLLQDWKVALCLLPTWHATALALDATLDISQYGHSTWKIREGFLQTRINSIAQTPDGYLWLATSTGLFRFDGVRSAALQLPAGSRLPSDDVRKLLVDRDGGLWIGTIQGLARWKDGKLTLLPQLAGQGVVGLVQDRLGAIWASGQRSDGAANLLCAIEASQVRCFGHHGSLESLYALYEDRLGRLWAAGTDAIWRLNPRPSRFHQATSPPCGFVETDERALLLFSWDGIRRIDDEKGATQPVPGTAYRCSGNLLRDRDGGVWIGSLERGLWHAHRGITDRFAHADGLSGDWVTAIFEDREGSVWIATQDGLDRFTDVAVATITQKQGLSGGNVSSVLAAADGSVWLGTYDGLNQWKDGQLTIYRKRAAPAARTNGKREIDGLDAFHLLGSPRFPREVFDSGLPDDYIESLFQDDRGRIWVSTRSGLARFQDGRFVSLGAVASGWIHSFVADGSGGFWFGDDHRLVHMSQGAVVESVPYRVLGLNGHALTLIKDPFLRGIWLGMWPAGGVAYYEDGKIRASFTTMDGLGAGAVFSLRFDAGGALWAATQGGLSRIKDGHVATLNSQNGLPCDPVVWSMETDDHSSWEYLACGLVRIERTELDAWSSDPARIVRATLLDWAAGVRSHPLPSGGSPAVARTADGSLWFLPNDGASVLDPRHLLVNRLPPPVHVEQIVADHKSYDAASIVRLPPLVRDLQIDYTALSFVAPEKNRFRYKLEGRDEEWKDAGNRRQAFYANLDPGTYRFRVIASNNSGVWNEQGATLDFSIAPAYWQTNWFRALCVAILAALLWTLYRLRVHQLARRFNLTLEARVNERTRIARDLHDTLLQSFHGLLLRFQTAREMFASRPKEALEVLDGAIDQAIDAVTEGRQAVQGLRSSTEETNDFADAVRGLGDALAAEQGAGPGVTLRIDVQGAPRELHPIVRDELVRIAGEAMRNAFRHAEAKQVEVEIRYDDRRLRVHVRDDGKGIDTETLKAGGREGHFGLPGMRERARLIGARLTVWSRDDQGTEVEVSIPAAHAYASPLPGTRWRDRFGSILRRRAEPPRPMDP